MENDNISKRDELDLQLELSNEEKLDLSSEALLTGRDSGISTLDSIRTHEQSNGQLLNQVERQLENIVQTSQKELQEAKQKLEELRLLRFEEKSCLRKEIDDLHNKVGEEERNSSELESKVKRLEGERDRLETRLTNLLKEQTVGSQINMMQEQEIVRLEMKLKGDELERLNLSKQLDYQRKTIIEKDRIRMKQQDEIYSLTEKISTFQDSLSFYKTENETNIDKLSRYEKELESLRKDVISLSCELETQKAALSKARLEKTQMEAMNKRLQDDLEASNIELAEQKDSLQLLNLRFDSQDEEARRREILLQQELDHSSYNEEKLEVKYALIEKDLNELQRKKEQQEVHLKEANERVSALEDELGHLNDEKNDVEVTLSELQSILVRHIRGDMLKEFSIELQSLPTRLGMQNRDTVTADEINHFFVQVGSKLRTLQNKINQNAEERHDQESVLRDLRYNIRGLKTDLQTAHDNLLNSENIKSSLDDQYDRLNATFKIQEKEIERKTQEIERLKKSLKVSGEKVVELETNITLLQDESKHNEIMNTEERRRLKDKLKDLENEKEALEKEKISQENELKEEKLSLQLQIQEHINDNKKVKGDAGEKLNAKEKETEELKTQMQTLIDDNKNLAQRLIHLESYSDRLSNMLENQESEKEKLKEKIHNELQDHKTSMIEKNTEIGNLMHKTNELNRNLHDSSNRNDRLMQKYKNSKEKVEGLEKRNGELEQKIKVLRESKMVAERKIIALNDEIDNFTKRFEDQTKNVEELFSKIKGQETENQALKDDLLKADKRIQLKETLIAELSKKTNNTIENYNELKNNNIQLEEELKKKEQLLKIKENEKQRTEKHLREMVGEESYLKDQMENLQKLLARAEDEKETSLNELSDIKRQLDAERLRNEKMLNQTREHMHHKNQMSDMQTQLSSMRLELDSEKRRRERLENLYSKRDDQVTKLRLTFDESLNAISTDTNNIKSILGKSLKKIDKQIHHGNATLSDSDFTETDLESNYPSDRLSSNKYLELPNRSKSLDISLDKLYAKVRSSSKYSLTDRLNTTVPSIPSSRPTPIQEIPERDIKTSNRKANKRLTR